MEEYILTLSNKNKINLFLLILIVTILISFLGYSTFVDINRLLKNINVTRATITINNVKAGFYEIQSKTITTSDSEEIQEILAILKRPLFYKSMPHIGNVPANSSDRIELNVGFLKDNNESIEYTITSTGDMIVKRQNGKYNSNIKIYRQNTKTLFHELKAFFDSKERNKNWTEIIKGME